MSKRHKGVVFFSVLFIKCFGIWLQYSCIENVSLDGYNGPKVAHLGPTLYYKLYEGFINLGIVEYE